LKILNTRNLVLCFLFAAAVGRATPTGVPPKFEEVYQLLRSNLDGVSQADLDRAAVKGLIDQFPGQVLWASAAGTNAAITPTLGAPLEKVSLYDDAYAYFRITRVEGNLAEKLRTAWQDLARTNKSKIKGLILDLRFAAGTDYRAAATAADCFLNSEQLLLDWGTGSARATLKSNAITVPVAVLVNSETSAAAEALAAALRECSIGLILGATTAGQANIFKDFSLADGQKLRVAIAQIKLGDGTTLAHGLKPDIAIDTTLADDRAYLDDPYKILHPPPPSTNHAGTNASLAGTEQPNHRPTNEAELVRERRAGEPLDEGPLELDDQTLGPDEPPRPALADTALARALDLLKGMAVLQQSRPG
jgi:carboxyl-terminal processing protease